MSAPNTITLSFPESGIAMLTLDTPGKGANVLSHSILDELAEHLDQLDARTDLAGIIVCSGKPGTFIAGADLREFAASFDIPKDEVAGLCTRGRQLFARLAACPFVTVAAIDGICVGGGAELAIWCDRRVLSDNQKTEFGFPEVKLGLFPGWGGTVRTPRIAGLYNAVEMITGGDAIDAQTAVAMGLATDCVPADRLLAAAVALVRDEHQSGQYLKDREQWSRPIELSDTEMGFLGVTASGYIQQQTKGHYPAPVAALEVLLGGAGLDADAAGQLEAEGMGEQFGSPVNRALINVFFLNDRNKKDTGLDRRGIAPREINTVSVIGAGIMGQGIASANVRREVHTAITDTTEEALEAGVKKILEEVSYNKKIKGPDVERTVHYGPLLNATVSGTELAASDLVIEAVIERADIKKQVYARLEPQLADHAVLASNTSTIMITGLAEDLTRPDRFVGLHFFNPVRKMPLVEVIRGAETSDATVATIVAYAKRIGKSPIVIQDGPGFLVNRLLAPYMNEAVQLLTEGASPKAIDTAAKAFGMPMGPIELYDVVGIDTALYAGRIMQKAFADRAIKLPLVQSLVDAGRLGRKTGHGFFSYENRKRRPEADPALDDLLQPLITAPREHDGDELADRLFLPMLLEATRVWEDKLVRNVRDIDLGLIFGIGFPPFKGGLLFWADTLGAAAIAERLKPLEPLGKRFEPTDILRDLASSSGRFYGL